MTRRRHFNSTYRRALWLGLGLSLGAHALALAFGRFTADLPSPDTRAARVLQVVVSEQEEEPVMEVVDLEGYAIGTGAAPALSEIMGSPGPSRAASLAPGAASESAHVLASAASMQFEYPIVPRPALNPMTAQTGFAPMFAIPSEGETLAAAEAEAGDGSGPGGGSVRVSVGTGGDCPVPSTILINRRLPVSGTIGRSPVWGGGGL